MDTLLKFSNWFERLLFQLLGPPETGPYGPPVAPPVPRPRDARGVKLTDRKIARLAATPGS